MTVGCWPIQVTIWAALSLEKRKRAEYKSIVNLLQATRLLLATDPDRQVCLRAPAFSVVKFYGREGASSGLGFAVADGAGKTAGGEFVGLEVIFDFAWSIFDVSDWFCGSRVRAFCQ